MSTKKASLLARISSRFLNKAVTYFTNHPGMMLLMGSILVLVIGVIGCLTGYEIGVSSFYLIPIVMLTWVLNKKAGVYISCLSVVIWIVAEQVARRIIIPSYIVLWNASIRLTFFLIIVKLLSALKISYKKEQELASHDYLTEVINSRYFYELASRELKRMSRHKKSFTLAYMDVDNFKKINDTYGHLAGDSLLKSVAETIKNATREIDIVGRLGGDEFAILMPLTDYDGAREVVSRVRREVEDHIAEHKWGVSLSIGIVTFSEPTSTVDEMVSLADEQMYLAKKNGKNMIKHIIINKRK